MKKKYIVGLVEIRANPPVGGVAAWKDELMRYTVECFCLSVRNYTTTNVMYVIIHLLIQCCKHELHYYELG
jgi:hypothetical protein